MAKSSKSHPTDSDVGVRKAESGVGRLRGFASKPSPPLSLSALRPLFRHRNQVGNRLAGKNKAHVAGTYLLCRHRRHHQSALSFDAEKRGYDTRRVRHGVAHRLDLARPVQRRGSRNPAENDVRRLLVLLAPKVHEKTFSFFSAFRWRKAAKATRPIPMSASERLKAASGDCAGLRANRPRRSRFQPSVRSSAIGTRSGPAYRKRRGNGMKK